MPSTRTRILFAILVAAATLVSGCAMANSSPPTVSSAPGSALAAVRALVVAPDDAQAAAAYSGHREDLFGKAWDDNNTIPVWGENRCKTRGDALKRDLAQKEFKYGNCVPHTGVLHDVYSGRTVQFRSGTNPSAIEVDHVVALAYAFRHGASQWTQEQRIAYANDPLVIQSVARAENQRKKDDGAADFLPSNPAARCGYVSAQAAVLTSYHLTVTARDKDAMEKVLSECGPDVPLPTRASAYSVGPVRVVR